MRKILSLNECKALRVGETVVFHQDYDVYPLTVVPEGTTGTVARNALADPKEHTLHILLDDPALRAQFAEWDGCVILGEGLYPEDGFGSWDDEAEVARSFAPTQMHGYLTARGYTYQQQGGDYHLYFKNSGQLTKAEIEAQFRAIGMRCPSHNRMGYRNEGSEDTGSNPYFAKTIGPYTDASAHTQGPGALAQYVFWAQHVDKS